MKLYLQDEDIIFDYTDVDFKNTLDKKYQEYFDFMRVAHCDWEYTLRKQVKRLDWKEPNWFTEYDKLLSHSGAVSSCYYVAQRYSLIEVSDDIKTYLDKLNEQCEELAEKERIKAQMERAEAEAKAQWKAKCEHGCAKCQNLRKWEDDFVCAATEEWLDEKLYNGFLGNKHVINMPVPFPTENCPFNINNIKEKAV